MRDYGKLYVSFWTSPDVSSFSYDAKFLAVYLLTSPHSNLMGAYHLPIGYITTDLKWEPEKVLAALAELEKNFFVSFCKKTNWVFIHKFLKWNPPENSNQLKCISKLSDQVHKNCFWKSFFVQLLKDLAAEGDVEAIFDDLIDSIRNRFETVAEPLPNGFKTVSKPFGNPFETVSKPIRNQEQEQEIEQEIEQEQERECEGEEKSRATLLPTIATGKPSPVEQARPQTRDAPIPDGVQKVFDHWRETMGHKRAALDKKRKRLIKNALAMGYTPEQLCDAVSGCAKTPHNIGQNDRGQRYDGLGVILRDADQIDRFLRNCHSPPSGRKGIVSQAASETFAAGERWLHRKFGGGQAG